MPSQIYNASGTPVTIADSAQTPTAIITLSALAAAAGRSSAQWDRGAGSQPGLYRWRGVFQATSAPTVGGTVALYLAFGNGTVVDGNLGTADAALSSATDKIRNLLPIGLVQADVATGSVNFIASGLVEIMERFVTLAVVNNLSVALLTSTSAHKVTFTPVPPEVQ